MQGKRRADGPDVAGPRPEQAHGARAATLRVIERHGAQVMRTARRYAATPEDAEDAYQRAVEIMLTKAPEIPEVELVPWLKTVVRHEAFALRRKHDPSTVGGRASVDGSEDGEELVSQAPTPEEQLERLERLRLGAEAMNGLKPQEARALSLLAQGYSYRQICDQTGWSYTKVNRCLAEGRQAFVKRVTRIESGAECERLSPKLSALVDGEVAVDDVALLRHHLRGCVACRATMRELQLAPAAIGALALAPLPLFERLASPFERLFDLAAVLRMKVESLFRLGGLDPTSGSTHLALSGGTRGVASTGLAKALALLCVGGAGVGGVAAVEGVLERDGAGSAKAATEESEASRSSRRERPGPSDLRLTAERFREPEGGRRTSTASGRDAPRLPVRGRGGKPVAAEPQPERRRAGRARRSETGAPQPASWTPRSPTAPEPDREKRAKSAPSEDDRSRCTPTRHPDDLYSAASEPRHPDDAYDSSATSPRHRDDLYEASPGARHPDDLYDGDTTAC
jgi:RNA polymerase sigma factor (sigma-70 family)